MDKTDIRSNTISIHRDIENDFIDNKHAITTCANSKIYHKSKTYDQLRSELEDMKNLIVKQSEFLALIAHEFRTPLCIALFQLEDMFSNHKNNPTLLEDVSAMGESLYNLRSLSDRLFNIQKYDFDKVKLDMKTQDIIVFIKSVFNDFKVIFEYKNKSLSFISSLKIDILNIDFDSGQMRQVLTNILNNSLRFADEVIIDMYTKDEKCFISISDNGCGVPDIDKIDVFSKFKTSETLSPSGLGIGLYICKNIVELHGGDIHVEDSILGGATFVFSLNL